MTKMSTRYTILIFLFVVVFAHTCAFADPWPVPDGKISPKDRILILAPHPDDEVLGCAGIIQKAVAMNVPVSIVFLTYGDMNEWSFLIYRKHFVLWPGAVKNMGQVRHDEAIAAAAVLGISPSQLTFLGYPDFGTMRIWYRHWGPNRPPYRGVLTRVKAVPYKNALRPGALYKGEEVVRDLADVIGQFQPTKIFLSHPADHNGDHAALYLFTRVALWDLNFKKEPELFPYLTHHAGWPQGKGLHMQETLDPPDDMGDQIAWRAFGLTPQEVNLKLEALKAHKSQYQSTPRYLISFIRSNELFGDFPKVRFSGGSNPMLLSGKKSKATHKIPEELNEQERSSFIGIEQRSLRIEGEDLVVSIELSRPLAEEVNASVYLFGYRRDQSFALMPKINVKLGVARYKVFDQNTLLPSDSIRVSRSLNEITIRIPLKTLGSPQKILTSARTYIGTIPLDWFSWRVVELGADSKK